MLALRGVMHSSPALSASSPSPVAEALAGTIAAPVTTERMTMKSVADSPIFLVVLRVLLSMAGHRSSIAWLHELQLRESTKREALGGASVQSEEEARGWVPQRVNLLRTRLVVAFLSMSSAVAAAFVVGRGLAVVRFSSAELGAASAFVFAWAGLARLGWAGASFKGDTPVERADSAIFQVMCWFGMYLAAAAVL